MASETLHFPNARLAQALYANEPKNLRLLEDLLGLRVAAREDWISLEGDPANIAKAKTLFAELQKAVARGAVIRRQEFSQAVSAATRNEPPPLPELSEERIEVSTRHRPVVPRTPGQKRYVEAIRKNDIVVGIGPAGTGKTYLAMAMAVNCLRRERVGEAAA
ncbi:MAG: PhoH family protein [Verrucomicrobiae bacterium]|nr:PhoH family protein [Verrucomicrobiae bacterium]